MSFIGGSIPTGIVVPFAGSTAPTGWLLCFGQTVSRTQYAALFAVISTTYGVGDGSTTFGLPDLRGRSVSGKDDMGGSAANRVTNAISGITGTTLGAVGGSESMTAHTHGAGSYVTTASSTGINSVDHTHTFTTGTMSANATHAHNGTVDNQFGTSGGIAFGATNPLPNNTAGGANMQITTDSRNINHTHSGTTNGISQNHTHTTPSVAVTGTSTSTGAGASQNMIPTIILNQIIKV